MLRCLRPGVAGKEQSYDVLTEHRVARPIYTEPKTWDKSVSVSGGKTSIIDFVITEKGGS